MSDAPGIREGGVTPATLRKSLGRLWRYFTLFEWAVIAVLAVIFLAGLYAGAMRLAPYEPYAIHDYDVIPNAACTGEVVQVEVDREVSDEYHMDFIRYESRWVETEESARETPGAGRRVVGSEAGMLEVPPPGREKVVSPIVRGVPTEGEWILENDVEPVGSIGGVRRTQDVTAEADEPLVVTGEELPDGTGCQ